MNFNSYLVIDFNQIGSAEISTSELYDLFGNQVEPFINNEDRVIRVNAIVLPKPEY